MKLLRVTFGLALICLAWANSGVAGSYALLVGVSDYDNSFGITDLRGPANDVRLMRDVLNERGTFEITLLADGVDGAARPTRSAILGALDKLAEDTVSGDFVYIHLSGHGTRQADQNGDESDGADEVFLPADTARGEAGTATMPNAIVDEELGQRIAAMRQKGVDVWFVLDSCHSGSGLRAASPRVATRFVDPAALGIELPESTEAAATAAVEGPGDADLPGKYVAFYSAQSSELAREIQVDDRDENSWYGLFTSRLAARLQANQALSYRQLFQAILSDLNDDAVPGAARLQTPLWDGNLIDAPVFGGGDVVGVRQFAVDGNRIQAGKLHGLLDNTVVALVADAASSTADVLAYAQLENTDATSAALAPVALDCAALTRVACDRVGTLPAEVKFARIAAKPLDTALQISPPSDLATGATVADTHPLAQALVAAIEKANAELGTNIQLSPNASVLSGIADGRLWFGTKISAGNTPVGLAWDPARGNLDQVLLRISKAEQLATMFSSVAGAPSLMFPSPVAIEVVRASADPSKLRQDVPDDLVAECRASLANPQVSTDMPAGQSLKQCDQMVFRGQGLEQGGAFDVNRVYIDSQFCVMAEYQRVEGIARAALLGGEVTVCSDCPDRSGTTSKSGAERMFFVVTQAERNREALNLQGLVNTCDPIDGATRAASSAGVRGFLSALSENSATRGSMGSIGIANIWVEKFNWQVLPRREALSQAGIALNQ